MGEGEWSVGRTSGKCTDHAVAERNAISMLLPSVTYGIRIRGWLTWVWFACLRFKAAAATYLVMPLRLVVQRVIWQHGPWRGHVQYPGALHFSWHSAQPKISEIAPLDRTQ